MAYPIPKPTDIICPKWRFYQGSINDMSISRCTSVDSRVLYSRSFAFPGTNGLKDPFLRWSDYFDNIDSSSNIGYMIEDHQDRPKNQEWPPIWHETKQETRNISDADTNYCTSFSEISFRLLFSHKKQDLIGQAHPIGSALYFDFFHLPNLSDTIPETAAPITNATKVIDEIIVAIICLSHNKLNSIRAEYKPLLNRMSSNS